MRNHPSLFPLSSCEGRLCLRYSCAHQGSSSPGRCVAAVTREWQAFLCTWCQAVLSVLLWRLHAFNTNDSWWTPTWFLCLIPLSLHSCLISFVLQSCVCDHFCLMGAGAATFSVRHLSVFLPVSFHVPTVCLVVTELDEGIICWNQRYKCL